MGQVLFKGMKIFLLGGMRWCNAPLCKFGAPHILESTGARKLKFYTHLDGAKCSFSGMKIIPL